jgi:hypothetical protein
MTGHNIIEIQTGLPHAHTPLTAHAQVGFELGWDYAHYRVNPPAPYAQEVSPLRDGLLAGRTTFGQRTLGATRHVRKWLQLRLHAWLRGRSVELVQVTPNYLQQIEVSHCPITRSELSNATLAATDASVDRVRNDAGYAAGNLAMMSTKANHAKGAFGYRDAMRSAARLESLQKSLAGKKALDKALGNGGLTAAQWSRVAILCSFVEPLSHQEASGLPLLVLPPNRLRLFNPAQWLQAFVSFQLLRTGWSQRLGHFEDLLLGKELKRDFRKFVITLLSRVIESGSNADSQRSRWAIEDAWRVPLTQQRWSRFVSQLSADECEALVMKASSRKLATTVIERFGDGTATEGWNLDTRGYVPQRLIVSEGTEQARSQQHLAW